MAYRLSMSEARDELTRLPDKLREEGGQTAVTVTRRGEPVLAVLPYELYEALMETLEIVADPELLQALWKSLREIEEGRTLSLEELDRALGIE